jgi:CHAD domain-containing protein
LGFCFRADQSIAKGTQRIARRQMDRALDQLTRQSRSAREEAVHDARRRFKRIRALLRLVRKSLGERRYLKENACFREAGRLLAEVRDARVLVGAFEELTRRFPTQLAGQSFVKVAKELLRRQEDVSRRVFEHENALAKTAVIVDAARRRLDKWKFAKDDRATLRAGLKKMYRRGSEAFSAVLAERTTDKLHEWRKRVKDLWHQLQLLQPIWPAIAPSLLNQAHTLSDYLGADHDLAVLRDALTDDAAKLADCATVDVLLPLIDGRRLELQEAAQLLGQQVYREKPKIFVRRLVPEQRKGERGS